MNNQPTPLPPQPDNQPNNIPPVTPPAETPPVVDPTPAATPVVPQFAPAETTPPATAPEQPAQKPDSVTTEREQTQTAGILTKFFFIILGLLTLFYALFLGALFSGELSNPLFETIGLAPDEIKETLLMVTNAIFGLFSLIFLIATLVKLFQWIMADKDDAFRPQKLKRSGVYFAILILVGGMWTALFWFISNASVVAANDKDSSIIVSTPADLIGLESPVMVEFDIGEKLFSQLSPDLVRQIDWDFNGDGVFDASGPKVTYEFIDKGENNGRYLAQVEVKYFSPESKSEQTYKDSREVIITNEKVVPDIEANPLIGQAPLAVRLSAKKSRDPDGEVIQYEWDLDGDKNFEIRGPEKVEVDNVFTTIGEHVVRLRVTGRNNDFSVREQTIVVKAPDERLRAQITSKNSSFSGLSPLDITLDGSQSYVKLGQIVKYEWFIEGEPTSVIGRSIKRNFDKPGTYSVKLVVEDAHGEKDEVEQIVTVFNKSEIQLDTNPRPGEDGVIRGMVPLTVTFDSTQSEIPQAVEWQWDFDNDGIVDEFAQTINYTFRTPGTYETKLTIIDADGVSHEQMQTVITTAQDITAVINADPIDGERPLVVNFDGSASVSGVGKIVNYIWEFPGVEPINASARISRKFSETGVIPVKLTVVNDNGDRHTGEILVSVREPSVRAEFSVFPQAGKAPLTVEFDSEKATGDIREYSWDFGDGYTSKKQSPMHTFYTPGQYEVKLEVADDRGIVSESTKVVVVE